MTRHQSLDTEKPLRDDIRLLGRLLGEVIEQQEGRQTFDIIEQIRRLSVAFRRDADLGAQGRLNRLLNKLSTDRAVSVVRAFTLFSHLANLAEDQHHVRRRRWHERLGHRQAGSLEQAVTRLLGEGMTTSRLARAISDSHVSAVLTAHPTEVQRKSVLDAEREMARLLAHRDDLRESVDSQSVWGRRQLEDNEALLQARVLQLWQTRLLRLNRLTVANEIDNALSYYELTFLREIPGLYQKLEQLLPGQDIDSFFRMGHWMGGDRDGNPYVDGQTLRLALARQCEVASSASLR